MPESSSAPAHKPLSDQVMIQMEGVHKWYGAFHVLKNINLTVRKSERIVICGPSGSGKSTTIRCINRLEEYQRGRIAGGGGVRGAACRVHLDRRDDPFGPVLDGSARAFFETGNDGTPEAGLVGLVGTQEDCPRSESPLR